jgi:hypothetical protein
MRGGQDAHIAYLYEEYVARMIAGGRLEELPHD